MAWIITLVIALIIGYLAGRRRGRVNFASPNRAAMVQKQEHLDTIMKSFAPGDELSNDKVQDLLQVSDATAERYLNELEYQGKLRQIGKAGKYVIYHKL
ncbi:MAG: hypothetical protein A3H72_01450 [Candidatus Doudnabacteria bacterium RIFCSPLOWO2_02_FULL_48_8]|uniref:HTH deoR-type domain-containing protein n=1 Tax=Candidatus Doudnabacteria bacterium RIFCSPHIGHO2_01_FULL_46_24 TaxID=1817825 RepID=A0A1F5NTV1_9BACT|nr:MAG: hypothetical protein A2720_00970 [Candidatus Doudnabacteria bacterium RIFCSPHIGHO2_01_FULL_46_24]OGE95415.1 MAG: hypothetical protein A3H72_01450 [Candidatus Doudnabacteria bacterium RIFCSPLOWO2_02_FULL_48_8]OGE95465.1 MAG: hypothetical protein A3E98_01055 [Candidatus Doudnabacteria bacterium RIFCSPHIGHO2_12_FULL_48_11]